MIVAFHYNPPELLPVVAHLVRIAMVSVNGLGILRLVARSRTLPPEYRSSSVTMICLALLRVLPIIGSFELDNVDVISVCLVWFGAEIVLLLALPFFSIRGRNVYG